MARHAHVSTFRSSSISWEAQVSTPHSSSMALKPRFETLLNEVIAYHADKTNTDKGADPFAKFVETYIADGHKNIIIAGAIMA